MKGIRLVIRPNHHARTRWVLGRDRPQTISDRNDAGAERRALIKADSKTGPPTSMTPSDTLKRHDHQRQKQRIAFIFSTYKEILTIHLSDDGISACSGRLDAKVRKARVSCSSTCNSPRCQHSRPNTGQAMNYSRSGTRRSAMTE